jgi:hypothetical protein
MFLILVYTTTRITAIGFSAASIILSYVVVLYDTIYGFISTDRENAQSDIYILCIHLKQIYVVARILMFIDNKNRTSIVLFNH